MGHKGHSWEEDRTTVPMWVTCADSPLGNWTKDCLVAVIEVNKSTNRKNDQWHQYPTPKYFYHKPFYWPLVLQRHWEKSIPAIATLAKLEEDATLAIGASDAWGVATREELDAPNKASSCWHCSSVKA